MKHPRSVSSDWVVENSDIPLKKDKNNFSSKNNVIPGPIEVINASIMPNPSIIPGNLPSLI